MTPEERAALKPGDIIQNLGSGEAYIVIDDRAGRVIAVRTVEASNIYEWKVVRKGYWIQQESNHG